MKAKGDIQRKAGWGQEDLGNIDRRDGGCTKGEVPLRDLLRQFAM